MFSFGVTFFVVFFCFFFFVFCFFLLLFFADSERKSREHFSLHLFVPSETFKLF